MKRLIATLGALGMLAAPALASDTSRTYDDGAVATVFPKCYAADVCAKITFADGRSITVTSNGYTGGYPDGPLDAHLVVTTMQGDTVINSAQTVMNIAGNQTMQFDHGKITVRFNLRRERDYIDPELQ